MRGMVTRSRLADGAASATARWCRRGAGLGGAVTALLVPMVLLPLLVLLTATGRAADAAEGSGAAGADHGPAAPDRLPAVVALPVTGPLTALGGAGQSLTCVQTPVAVDAAGRTGVLAPQVGVTVIRGSAAPSPSLTWVVVPTGQVAGNGEVAVTVCTPTR